MKKSVLYIVFLLILACSVCARTFDNEDLSVNGLMIGDYGVVDVYGDFVPMRITLTNEHETKNMGDLKIKIEMPELGVIHYTNTFDLRDGERDTRWAYLELPRTAKFGEYLVKVTVSNDDVKRINYRYLLLI